MTSWSIEREGARTIYDLTANCRACCMNPRHGADRHRIGTDLQRWVRAELGEIVAGMDSASRSIEGVVSGRPQSVIARFGHLSRAIADG